MRKAGQLFNPQLGDPNLPCRGESLLPNAELAYFDADPVERARQLVIANGSNNWPSGRDNQPREIPVKYYPGMGYAPYIPKG